MNTRIIAGAAAAAALTIAAAAPAQAAPTKVNVRVEGATKTLFEGNVVTDIRMVQGDASGPHKCDGTNGGASTTPTTTLTTAFSDAMRRGGIDWSGSWSNQFEDFLIDRVGQESSTSSQFWGTALNFKDTEVGGCQQPVVAGDQVLVVFDGFGKTKLKLTGARGSRSGEPFALFVLDGATGKPIAGATVAGQTSNSQGRVLLRRTARRLYRFKATAPGEVRSNTLKVRVK